MINQKRIAVIIPAYNEENQLSGVISGLPEFVDSIIVVDDCSTDNTLSLIRQLKSENPKVIELHHEVNQGAGAAVATAYEYCKRNQLAEIYVTVDADGQMNPNNIEALIQPIISEEVGFTKGNRFLSRQAWEKMPFLRFIGNAFLSLLTKIASGYWHISDFQTGFTAISAEALKKVDWKQLYPRYGYPNHRAVLLNVEQVKARDVQIDVIYGVGEQSKMNIGKVLFTMSSMLIKQFLWRMKEKYIIRDFHPLVFFYFLGILFGVLSFLLFGRVFYYWWVLGLKIPSINALAAMFSFMSSSLFILFGMWFDLEINKELK